MNYQEELIKNINHYFDSNFQEKFTKKLIESSFNDNYIYVAGNGGSAATSSHMVCDFAKNTKQGLKMICISDSVPIISAYANDVSYDDSLAKYFEILSKKNDILIVISVSGSSKNIIQLLKIAKQKHIFTIGLLGKKGGFAKDLCDLCYIVDSNNYGIVEDLHGIIMHSTVEELKK